MLRRLSVNSCGASAQAVIVVQVAIKFIQRGEKMAGRYVEREIVNHSMLLHPHIIQFKEVCLI